MDLRYGREAIVGTLVIVAISVFVLGTMWLSGRTPSGAGVLVVEFADVSGLKKAAPVRISGVQVGKVEDIRFIDVGRVHVTINIPTQVKPKVDASAMITPISLVGDYAVDFVPGKASEPLPEGRIIVGQKAGGLQARAADIAERADSVLIGIQALANEETAENLQQTLKALQRTLSVLADRLPRTTNEATAAMVAFRKLAERLDSTVATIPIGNTIERADTLARNLSTMSLQLTATGARLDSILQKVNAGQGSLGLMATDSGLYLNARNATQSLQLLLDELRKHPGKIQVQVKIF